MKTTIHCIILFCSTQLTSVDTFSKFQIIICETSPAPGIFNFMAVDKRESAHSKQCSLKTYAGLNRLKVHPDYIDHYSNYSNRGIVVNINNSNIRVLSFLHQSILPFVLNNQIVAINTEKVIPDFYTTPIA